MKTFCVHLPRNQVTEAGAIIETRYTITTGRMWKEILDEVQETMPDIFSFEILSTQQTMHFCFTAAGASIDVLSGLIYSIEPDAEIVEIPDFTRDLPPDTEVATAEIGLRELDIFPLQTHLDILANALSPLSGVVARIPHERRIIMQLVARKVYDKPSLRAEFAAKRRFLSTTGPFRPRYWFKQGVLDKVKEKVLQKTYSRQFWCNLRIAALDVPTEASRRAAGSTRLDRVSRLKELQEHVDAVFGAMSWVNWLDGNKIVIKKRGQGLAALKDFQDRYLKRTFRFTTDEMATFWHIPKLTTINNAAQVLHKKAPPPNKLPSDATDPQICFFGHTDYRDQRVPFGIRRFDRRRHMYCVGKSGSGKSCLLELLVKNDIDHGFGCAVLDPHGDLVDNILRIIPKHRIQDVVLFDPTDNQFPPSFNPLANVPPDLRMRTTISFVEIFKKIFGEVYNERMDQVLRFATMALLSTPGSTCLSLRRMLADERYRQFIIENGQDEAVRNFWQNEFLSRRSEFEEAAISPLLNRLGQLALTDTIRNIIGQPLNRFNFREVMDKQKILLMKVSKGMLGADNASLLGAMVIAKIYEAAMSRADIPAEQRQDFYFYVDEFHNFATESFDEILSESRKYRLNLTMANQLQGQFPGDIQKTVFGNVANILAFRCGGEDGGALAAEFQPRFSASDLINLGIREFYIKMAIDGQVQEAFSGKTLEVPRPKPGEDYSKECIEHSRRHYAVPLEQVSAILSVWDNESRGRSKVVANQ